MASTTQAPSSSRAPASKLEPAHTGVWVGIATISMSFAAVTSAMVVRQGAAPDWRHFELPPILYFNTLILVASSFTLELSRRRIAGVRDDSGDDVRVDALMSERARYWLCATLALGLVFVLGQLLAWRNLAAQGLFLATSPSSSFFYVFTALHGVHLLGGLAGLTYALRRLRRSAGPLQRSALGAASLYWHFMDGLWVYLLLILASRM